jgi:hypothetical protein
LADEFGETLALGDGEAQPFITRPLPPQAAAGGLGDAQEGAAFRHAL